MPLTSAPPEVDLGSTASQGTAAVRLPTIDAVWAWLAVALPICGALLLRNQALDLAYHIRAGNWMIDHRAILDTDVFTYSVSGHDWLNQQWGAQLILATVFRGGGWMALDILRGLLVGLTAFLVYRSCREVGGSPRTASILTIAGSVVAIEIIASLRPQQFGCLAFALVLWCVTTRRSHPARIWAVPVITLVWANVHGTFPLALVLLTFAAIEDLTTRTGSPRSTMVALVATAVASCLTPFGPTVWPYIVTLARHPIVSSRIAEWQSPSVESATGLLFFVSLGLVVVFLLRRRDRIGWIPLAKLLVFGGLSFVALRGVIWWALTVPVILAELIADDAAERRTDRSPAHVLIVGAIAGLIVISLFAYRGTDPSSGGPAMLTFAPERLVEAVRAEVPAGAAVFASQFHAPWAEFSAPEYRYHVDSRLELFPEDIWDRYIAISDGREGWSEMLDEDGVDALLLDPDQAAGLIASLPDHPDWELVATDADGSVYVRR
jgi:hypothetical protein